MVTGRVPFEGDTTVAIAIKHLQEEMVPPSVYAPDLPYSLEQIICKCTQKSVDRRYGKMEEVIADLKHSLIDPQGDFVKLTSVDNDAKTVVISDKELGEIKHTPKQNVKNDIEALEKELNETDYDFDYDEDEEPRVSRRERERERERERSRREKQRKKKKRSSGIALTIIALIAGAALLVVLIVVIGKASGLIGGNKENQTQQTQQVQQTPEDDGLVTVPDLVGHTEKEARELLASSNIGMQSMGEEASTQEKGKISSQDPVGGTQVEPNSTIKYYVSKGAVDVTIPNVDGYTGIEAQAALENLGLNVEVQRIYSELDENGYPLVDPGYAYYTEPSSGNTVKSGNTVTLVVSRGVDYGDSAEVPDVVGMERDQALTTLGKFIAITVNEERNPDVPAGEVISQSPEGYSYADPDQPMTITVSTGDQEPGASGAGTDNSAAVAAGEVWKCTQRLNTPSGYNGGKVRLELVQDVNGQPTASVVVEGQQLTFPYQLDITGAPGISEGTLYLSEMVDGNYQELGHYPLTFEKVE